MSEFVNRFIQALLKLPKARLSPNKREIMCRCPYCGDSKHDRNSTHLYIKVPLNDTISCYFCFRCQAAGIVTPSILIKWMITDNPEILIELGNYNKTVYNLPKNRRFSNTQIYRIVNNFITQCDLSVSKLKYLNWRLGTHLSCADLLSKKVVLNIYDLLRTNKIDKFTRAPMIMDQINSSFLGFISYDNAFVNMRRLVPEDKVHQSLSKRYINYNMFDKYDNSMKYYILPTNVSLSLNKRIKIHIAEGPMDILSIFYNLADDRDHSIFAAITGSSYFQMVQFFLVDLKLSYIEIHIYADNDKDDSVFYDINKLLLLYGIPLFIHRNATEGEKDFGVPKAQIKDMIYII